MDIDKLPVPGRQIIVHDHVDPVPVLPEPEVEHPGVLAAEALQVVLLITRLRMRSSG